MKVKFLFICGLFITFTSFSQVGIGTTTPATSSMLEVSSQTEGTGPYKGFMPPRVPDVSARDAISPTALDEGLLVFVRSSRCLQVWTGISWESIYCNESAALASDLFISEYVEGTVDNKAIEIANFTGSPINLDYYHLFISRNGGSNTSIITFNNSFILPHESVYVIKHPEASNAIIADQQSNNINFNGNDAVVLRTTAGGHIDILGEVGNVVYFAENMTLRKKPAKGPSTTYHPSDYEIHGVDDFSGLGSHTY